MMNEEKYDKRDSFFKKNGENDCILWRKPTTTVFSLNIRHLDK